MEILTDHPSSNEHEHTWAAACHLAAFAGFIMPVVGNIAGPLLVWAIKKDSSKLVDSQGKESMNFQISLIVYAIALTAVLGATIIPTILTAGLLLIVTIPIAVLFFSLIGIFELIMVIVASIAAAKGENYRYPLTIRFIK